MRTQLLTRAFSGPSLLALFFFALSHFALGCDETRGPIVTLHIPPDPTVNTGGQGGMHSSTMPSGGTPTMIPMDSGVGGTVPSGGMPAAVGGADAGAVVATCVPIPPKPYVAIANPSSVTGVAGDSLYNPPPQAVDDNVNTRWSTGVGQSGGEWIEVDFGVPVTLTRVELDHAHSRTDLTLKADWPRGYSVSMSYMSRDFGAPEIVHGEGTAGFTNIVFPRAATGRYLLIQQTEVDLNNWWSVHELTAFCGN